MEKVNGDLSLESFAVKARKETEQELQGMMEREKVFLG